MLEYLLKQANILPSLDPQNNKTPLTSHPAISKDFGVRFLIKREDRIDDIGSGNKLRKLSYIVPEALKQGATMLITVGSVPSNQCKAVASIAKKNNLKAHVIYGGDKQCKPTIAQGNYLLTSLFDPKISWFEFCPWQDIESRLQEVVAKEIAAGEKPFVITSGASTWPGLMGSIEMGLEIAQQIAKLNVKKLHIVLPSGSGGTCMGIHIAAELLNLPWVVHGICIGEPAGSLMQKMHIMKQQTTQKLPQLKEQLNNFYLHDIALGAGYDTPTSEELEEMRYAYMNYGLILDHNYMLKAFIGAKKLISHGTIESGADVLLVHTGGQYGVFDNNIQWHDWHKTSHLNWINSSVEI